MVKAHEKSCAFSMFIDFLKVMRFLGIDFFNEAIILRVIVRACFIKNILRVHSDEKYDTISFCFFNSFFIPEPFCR